MMEKKNHRNKTCFTYLNSSLNKNVNSHRNSDSLQVKYLNIPSFKYYILKYRSDVEQFT